MAQPKQPAVKFRASDLSDSQVRDLICAALSKSSGSSYGCYVQDVNRAKGFFTYKDYGYSLGADEGLFRCKFSVDGDYAVTIGEPEKVVEITKYETIDEASFCVAGEAVFSETDESTRVYPSALLFRAGDYPDKQYSMTPAEILAAADRFNAAGNPVSINLEHAPAMLQGKLGSVLRLFSDDEGQTLRGEVALPTWLDDQLTDAERRVSAEWDRTTKTFQGLALTPTPRVQGAALMAAFSAANPTSAPAAKSGQEKKMPVTLKERVKALIARFTSAADAAPDLDADSPEGKALLAAVAGENGTAVPAPVVLSAQFADSPEAKKMAAEIADLRAAEINRNAEAFADGAIAAKRALPRERESLIASFKLAASDDAASPAKVSFSDADGKSATGSRVDVLRAQIAVRPAHQLLDEILSNGGAEGGATVVVMSSTPAGSGDDKAAKEKAEYDKCMNMTSVGQKAVAAKKDGAN